MRSMFSSSGTSPVNLRKALTEHDELPCQIGTLSQATGVGAAGGIASAPDSVSAGAGPSSATSSDARPSSETSSSDAGMSTVEYAVGTVVAAAFAAVLYRIVTGDSVISGLTDLINTALSTSF